MNKVNIILNILILIVGYFFYDYYLNKGYKKKVLTESKFIKRFRHLYSEKALNALTQKLDSLNMTFSRYISIKIGSVLVIIVIYILILLTNYQMTKQYVSSEYDYDIDSIYKEQILPDEEIQKVLLKKEMDITFQFMKTMSYNSFMSTDKDIIIQSIYNDYLYDLEWEIHKDISSHRIYQRIFDLYKARKISFLIIFASSYFTWTIVGIIINFLSKFQLKNKVRELDFLKELVIINGQIKPVSVNSILETLSTESTYNKTELTNIFETYNSLDGDVRSEFKKIYKKSHSSDITVFYENLERAILFDIDDAIHNFLDDAYNSKEIRNMEVDSTGEQIEAIGMLMFMLLMIAMIYYSITPWMSMLGNFG